MRFPQGLALPLLTATLLFAGGCERQKPDSSAEVWDSAGIRITRSTSPVWSSTLQWTWSDSALLTIGVAEGPTGVQFFGIAGVARLQDGRIAVADHGARGGRVFGPDGRFLSQSGREGSGPGESRSLCSRST